MTNLEAYAMLKAKQGELNFPVSAVSENSNFDQWIDRQGAICKNYEGTPPLTFKSSGRDLRNYRIYGNTVDGESVGDLVTEGEHTGEYCVPLTVNNSTTNIYLPYSLRKIGDDTEYIDFKNQKMYRIRKNIWNGTMTQGGTNNSGIFMDNTKRICSTFIEVKSGETYTVAANLKIRLIYSYDANNERVAKIRDSPNGDISYTFTVPNGASKIRITLMDRRNNTEYEITPADFLWGQLECGSTVTDYEPYIENTDINVYLPTISTMNNTNTLRIGTQVTPAISTIKGTIRS